MRFGMTKAAAMAVAFGGLVAGSAFAGDSDALAGYTRTGKTESCIRVINIQESRILNSHQILFKMRGGPDYLNEADHCTGLRPNLSLEYVVETGDLCDTTIVRIKDYSSPVSERGSCGLGKFQELSRRTAAN